MTYDASSIRVLSDDEIQEFDWYRAETLASEHGLPVSWVKRGFEVSHRLGMTSEYFENKYIHKQSVAKIPEFEAVFIEVLREDRRRANW